MKKEVTVIIPSYNPGAYLREALLSLVEQTYRDWMLYIIDDCSTDDSLDNIQDLLKDKRIKLVPLPINLGQSKCLNIGLQLVQTEFFMQLDSDDWLLPDALQVLMEEGQKIGEDTALIIGNVLEVYEDKAIEKMTRRVEWGQPYKNRYEILLANLFPWQKFYRTTAIKHLGGWPTDDPYEGRHAEDLFIFLKLIEKYRFHWVDKLVYKYRHHQNNSSKQLAIYQDIVKWAITDALKRWGNRYEPVFKVSRDGWVYLHQLLPRKI